VGPGCKIQFEHDQLKVGTPETETCYQYVNDGLKNVDMIMLVIGLIDDVYIPCCGIMVYRFGNNISADMDIQLYIHSVRSWEYIYIIQYCKCTVGEVDFCIFLDFQFPTVCS
jgi:hypothetical protein